MNTRKAMKKQNDTVVNLARDVLSSSSKSNVVSSPASINSAITMHAAGPGGEKVSKEILSFLGSSSIDDLKNVFNEISSVVFVDSSESGGPKITAVNGLWIERSLPVDPKLKDLIENFFKVVYVPVDFRSRAEEVRMEVNALVKDHTNNLINGLLPPGSVTKETEKIYANALYFKGTWDRPFDKSSTRNKDFHLVNGTSVSVPFMSSSNNQYVSVYNDFKVLRLPYRQGCDATDREFSMYFYLPDKKDGLDNLLEKMASTPRFVDSHIPREKHQVGEFRIPKFKIEFGFSTRDLDLGLGSMLLYHKACVEIDEDGAEASAATADVCLVRARMECPKRIDFVADHPFLFLIREDKTGTILFVGQLFEPSESCLESDEERSVSRPSSFFRALALKALLLKN